MTITFKHKPEAPPGGGEVKKTKGATGKDSSETKSKKTARVKPANDKAAKKATQAVKVRTHREVIGKVEVNGPMGHQESKDKMGVLVKGNGPLANVGVTMAYTKNLGNYESVKISVDLHMPCLPEREHLDKTFDWVRQWADEKIDAVAKDIDKTLAGGGNEGE